MPSLGGLFGSGSVVEQMFIWGVLEEVVTSLIAPFLTELETGVNTASPLTPLDAGTLATIVAKGLRDLPSGQSQAAATGINTDRFDQLVDAATVAADLATAVAAFQRGYIPAGGPDGKSVSLGGALKRAGVADEWAPIIEKLAVDIPSVAEVMNAWLEGQIGEGEARTRYLAAGGDPSWFQTAYNANGTAPTPMEALTMLNRGLIGESGSGPASTSYEQAFLEGPWRNKWLTPMLGLREYYPPPRTVTAMFHGGQLTESQAATYLAKQGLTADLIAAYLSPSVHSSSTAAKHLAKGEVLKLYTDQLISPEQAVTDLAAIGYNSQDAALEIELTNVTNKARAVTAGVNRVHILFQDGKITETNAVALLEELKITAAQAKAIVDTWAITRTAVTKSLTAAQIVDAWVYGLMPVTDAFARLLALGYDDTDAYLVIAVKNKGPVPGLTVPAGA